MVNNLKMSFASLFIVGSLLVSCSTPAEKVDQAEDDSRQSKKELRIAKEEYEKEMKEYRKTSEEKIAANEVKIAEFKARISTQKATAKADYEKKVNDLNSKNSDMKMRLDSFKFDSKTKWEAFIVISARAGWDFQTNNKNSVSTTPRCKNQLLQLTVGYNIIPTR